MSVTDKRLYAMPNDHNCCTATKFESDWTLRGGATVAMNKSKRLTHYMAVSAIAFRHNLRLSPTPAHAQPRGIRRESLVFHRVLPLKSPSRVPNPSRSFAKSSMSFLNELSNLFKPLASKSCLAGFRNLRG